MLVCLIIGFTCLVGFGIWEWKGTKNGLLAHSLFEHSSYPVVLLLNVVGGMVLFGGQAFLPQEVILPFTSDAVLTGVYSLSFNLASIIGGIASGLWVVRTKEAKGVVIWSFGMLIVGNCLMCVMQPHINYAAWFFPTILLGLSIGVQVSLLPVIVSVCTPNHLIGAAVTVVTATRGLGGSVGVVIFSQIFASKVEKYLPALVAERSVAAGLPVTSVEALLVGITSGSAALLEKVPGITPTIIAVAEAAIAQAYADSFRYLGISFWIKSTKDQMTSQIASGVEHRH